VGKVTVEQIEDVESLAREVRVSMDLAPEDFDTAVGIAGRQENIFTIRLTDWQRWVKDEEARRDLAGALALLSVELLPVLDVTPPVEDREPPLPRRGRYDDLLPPPEPEWREGTMYRIRTQSGGKARYREHVMTFMGKGGVGGDSLLFSARPFAGTVTLERDNIVAYDTIGKSNGDSPEHYANKVV
jgi:hypothetical protein